jgi:hypothetical protein
VAALGHKNIRRLDVAMDNSQRVGGIQAISNFDAEREQCLQFHGTVADDVLQRRAVEVLHDDERLAILLADVMNGADIRMVERRSGFSLAAEPPQGLRILSHIFRKELQSDEAVQAGILGLVNDAPTAAAQFVDDAVMRNGSADH